MDTEKLTGTPSKKIKFNLKKEDVEEDDMEREDIPEAIQCKRMKLDLSDKHGTTKNISLEKDDPTNNIGKEDLRKDDLKKKFSGKNDLEIIVQNRKSREGCSAFQDGNQVIKSIDSMTNVKTQQTAGVGPSSSVPDESENSDIDDPNDTEIDQLREFQVLDEVTDEDKKDSDENSDMESEEELANEGEEEVQDIADEEIEQMLEENLPEGFKGQPKPKPRPYGQRKKLVLEEKGINHFEVLPLDWIVVRHMSGMPIYLHRPTKVCTLAKPYFLGKASVRKHEIPISAIPCLNYRRALEEEEKQKNVSDPPATVDLTNGIDSKKSDTVVVDGETENVVSEKSSSSPCPFATEQRNSISEVHSNLRDNAKSLSESKPELDFNFIYNCEEKSGHLSEKGAIFCENSTTSVKGNSGYSNEMIAENIKENNPDSNFSSSNLMIGCKTDSDCGTTSRKHSEIAEKVVNVNTEVSSSTNLAVSSSGNNVANVENEVVTSTSKEKNIVCGNNINGNATNKDTSVKHGDITANITVVGNKKMLPGGIILPNVKIETASQENWKNQHLTSEQVTEYCKKLFHFRTINIIKFEQWSERRKYAMAKKTMQRPTLPEGTKLITISAQPSESGNSGLGGRPGKKEWVMNPNGRSYVCIFHDYVERALQKKPTYEFVQLENASTPYKVTVYLNGMQCGVGYGTSKRKAKTMAAKASIEVLIPEMRDQVPEDTKIDGVASRSDNPDFAFFDFVGIDDPRIAEFCAKTMEPSPHAILQTCLLRNFGVGSQEIKYETKPLKRQRIEFTMSVGKHTATVVCKNKKDGKQRAAQAILQALHPHIKSWGSLLRLYGSRSLKSFKEKKIEEQEITLLQGKATVNTPNYAILNKLKAEMERLRERDTAVVSIGTLIVTDDLPTHSGSNLDNVEI